MPARALLAHPRSEMLTEGESEGLQTLGIVVVVCSSLKLLHYLGLIDLSDGKRAPELPRFIRTFYPALIVVKVVQKKKKKKNKREVRESLRGSDGARLPLDVLALSVVLNCAAPAERVWVLVFAE